MRESKGGVNQKAVINFYIRCSRVGQLMGDCSDTDVTSQAEETHSEMEDWSRLLA